MSKTFFFPFRTSEEVALAALAETQKEIAIALTDKISNGTTVLTKLISESNDEAKKAKTEILSELKKLSHTVLLSLQTNQTAEPGPSRPDTSSGTKRKANSDFIDEIK